MCIRDSIEEELECSGVLHCVDNEEHDVFSEHGGLRAVREAAECLGLSELLHIHQADAFDMQLAGNSPPDHLSLPETVRPLPPSYQIALPLTLFCC